MAHTQMQLMTWAHNQQIDPRQLRRAVRPHDLFGYGRGKTIYLLPAWWARMEPDDSDYCLMILRARRFDVRKVSEREVLGELAWDSTPPATAPEGLVVELDADDWRAQLARIESD